MDGVWDIFQQVIAKGDTYVFHPDTSKRELQQHWFAPTMQTFVAEDQGKVFGTYVLKPNHIGLGDHIANCSYMVAPASQGRGIGKLLCEHSLAVAKTGGYLAMQFNIVVSTNEAAMALWKKYGFEVIGTTPDGFRHSKYGYVDTHIMYKSLVR